MRSKVIGFDSDQLTSRVSATVNWNRRAASHDRLSGALQRWTQQISFKNSCPRRTNAFFYTPFPCPRERANDNDVVNGDSKVDARANKGCITHGATVFCLSSDPAGRPTNSTNSSERKERNFSNGTEIRYVFYFIFSFYMLTTTFCNEFARHLCPRAIINSSSSSPIISDILLSLCPHRKLRTKVITVFIQVKHRCLLGPISNNGSAESFIVHAPIIQSLIFCRKWSRWSSFVLRNSYERKENKEMGDRNCAVSRCSPLLIATICGLEEL